MNHSVAPSLFITPDFSVPRLAGSFLLTNQLFSMFKKWLAIR